MGSIDGAVGAWGVCNAVAWERLPRRWAASLEASGGQIRSGAPVDQVLVRNGRATGVVLDSGEELHASIVVSNLDVKRTFLETMDAKDLPLEFVEQVRKFKIRGSSGKLNIALDGLPRFSRPSRRGRPVTRGDMHVTDTIEMMERAYDGLERGDAGPGRLTSIC